MFSIELCVWMRLGSVMIAVCVYVSSADIYVLKSGVLIEKANSVLLNILGVQRMWGGLVHACTRTQTL